MEASEIVALQGRVRVGIAAVLLTLLAFVVLLGLLAGGLIGDTWDALWKFLLLSGSSITLFITSSLVFGWLERRSQHK